MPSPVKIEKVRELKERIQAAEGLFVADFRGLTVTESTELRRSLRDSGARFSVVKNTLMKRAAEEAGLAELERLLDGPTAVAFVDQDPVAAAKSLVDATRRFRTLVVKGAFLEGRVLSPEEASALATIESREVLLAKVAGAAKAEMSRAAYMFKALQSRFLAVLDAYKAKLPGEEAEAEASPAPQEEAAAGASPAPQESPSPQEEGQEGEGEE
jgi:large subunit ribosomal protein L10